MTDVKTAVDQVTDSSKEMLLSGPEMLARKPGFTLHGRRAELKKQYNGLLRQNKNNLLVYGPSGVGLSSVGLGLQSCKDDLETPHGIVDKRFMFLQTDTLMASGNGKRIIEDFEKILKRCRQDKGTVLIIQDFSDFLKAASKNGATSIINAMMRDIRAKKFQARIEVRTHELGSVLKDYHSDLLENFIRIPMEEPSLEETQQIISATKNIYETPAIKISDGAVKEAVALTMKYRTAPFDTAQPDRTLQLLDQAMSEFRTEADSRPQGVAVLTDQMGQIQRLLDKTPLGNEGAFASLDPDGLSAKKAELLSEQDKITKDWEEKQQKIRMLTKKRAEIREKRDHEQVKLDIQLAAETANRAKSTQGQATDDFDVGDLNVDSEAVADIREMLESYKKDVDTCSAQISAIAIELDKGLVLTEKEIKATFSGQTGIPLADLTEDESAQLEKMEEKIGERVFGQDYAIQQVSKSIRIARAGLKDPEKPIGVYMFNGPTGVGKTELTKALAHFLYKDDFAMTRIDMSEFMEKVSVNRLIGPPPGYVGYEEGGVLTNAVMARPSQIILLDEIDKAHPDVFNVLLQVFDAGRLTDGQGRTAKFGETLIIMTSNLGAALYQNPDLTFEQATTAMREQVRGSFKPEFINRIDEIIGFNRLDGKNIKKVIRKEFNTLGKLVKDRGVIIDIDDSCVDKIAANENEGGHYDPAFGGRGIVRYLKMNAKDKLALEILAMPKGAKTNTRLTATYDTAARGIKILRESLDQPANMPVSPAIPTPKAA